MKFSSTRAFVNQSLLGLLVTIGFGGSVGLGTVWMRHQVSVLADTNRDLEQQYHDIERQVDDVSAQVESALSPDLLRAENDAMHLGLIEMTQTQITPVAVDPIARLVAKANRRAFERGASEGIGIAFNLPAAPVATATELPRATPQGQPFHAANPAPLHANVIQFATNP